jgi:hypothetical protein
MTNTSTALEVPAKLFPPVTDGIWIRPSRELPAQPVIGFKDGIRIALWPAFDGPRGVIRILAPYVCPGDYPKINFIAIEPIVGGWRGLSEIEHSKLDDRRGMRMWFSDSRDQLWEATPVGDASAAEHSGATEASPTGVASHNGSTLPWNPSRGKTGKIRVDGKSVETLTIILNIEEFDNGAHPIVQITFRADRPNEIGFRTYAAKDSAPMESCVLTATMGNFSRARLLYLKDEVLDARQVWPNCKDWDFVWTDEIAGDRIRRERDGTLTVAITPSETSMETDKIPEPFWQFHGKLATQYWRKYPTKDSPKNLRVRVNGRAFYYGRPTPIPGGVSFENFELIEDFRPGIESWFGVTLKTAYQMGWK